MEIYNEPKGIIPKGLRRTIQVKNLLVTLENETDLEYEVFQDGFMLNSVEAVVFNVEEIECPTSQT